VTCRISGKGRDNVLPTDPPGSHKTILFYEFFIQKSIEKQLSAETKVSAKHNDFNDLRLKTGNEISPRE
jgi:hypothetical protein